MPTINAALRTICKKGNIPMPINTTLTKLELRVDQRPDLSAIVLHDDFNASNLHGRLITDNTLLQDIGQLDILTVASIKFDLEVDDCYVIWSYDTPIAWWAAINGRWRVPAYRYSSATSRHQQLVRNTLDAVGEAWRS